MHKILAGNITRYRKALGMTLESLADKVGVTLQAVSKWENDQSLPDTALLPSIARELNVSIDKLLGYSAFNPDLSPYEREYSGDDYYWGVVPSTMCLKVLELLPPDRPLKLLDIGCGEGKDAVFFARCGYEVSAFDISEIGLDKVKRLADTARVSVRTFRSSIWDYRLEESYDVLYSSGVLHYIKPELRDEIMENYKTHINTNGIAALHTFVKKPFIERVSQQRVVWYWKTGELFTYFHDWYIESCSEYVFDCNSGGVPHKHAANRLFARNNDGLLLYK